MTEAVVITGASAGIGRTTAERIRDAGYEVINLDRTPCDSAAVHSFALDLTDGEALRRVLDEVSSRFEVTALVNNAGFARTSPLEDTDDALLRATFDVNLVAAARCAALLLPAMKRRGHGRIVNIASRSALGRELRTAYAASKGGLISMTRVWALELARFGITANCVAPGPIATDMFDAMNPEGSERRERMIQGIPAGRMGEPGDVAHAVCFFLSPDAGFVNGQTLYVCGGLSVGVAPL
ncbi:MAG: SDR family oxidoreductase [Alphaproteobacteria bacterium]